MTLGSPAPTSFQGYFLSVIALSRGEVPSFEQKLIVSSASLALKPPVTADIVRRMETRGSSPPGEASRQKFPGSHEMAASKGLQAYDSVQNKELHGGPLEKKQGSSGQRAASLQQRNGCSLQAAFSLPLFFSLSHLSSIRFQDHAGKQKSTGKSSEQLHVQSFFFGLFSFFVR